jgi:hypothetical protein
VGDPVTPCSKAEGGVPPTPTPTPAPTPTPKPTPLYTLVPLSLTVISNATQNDVTGAKNWAAVKKATDDVIVQVKTDPDSAEYWAKINWSGDSGSAVPGHPNQRSLSRATSKKFHVEAELGGVKDYVDVWILWSTVNITSSGTTPANAVQYGSRYDGTENLGAKTYNSSKEGVGKVVPVATITPAGVHDVVKSGWAFRRERISHDWDDGAKSHPGNGHSDYWNTAWVDDTSLAQFQKLVPDSGDQIYDRDAPNIGAFGNTKTSETYNNFRQWTEWHGEACSDKAQWHWRARWQKSASPQVTLTDVGSGNPALPDDPTFPP